ncbi:MAG TPA: ferrochelatase [Vicinamibacterales bacterium]|nr:ferrochelatase [Vicinamibacterales bacterium]
MPHPFDAVLLIAFGGPQHRDHIRPFLANVLRGRRVSPERVEEVVHHYEIFDGISPITELTMRQAERLRHALQERAMPLPVYVGMRNWDPYLRDTLVRMSGDGIRHAVAVVAAAHRSYSGCTQYRENVADARAALKGAGLPDVSVTYINDWHASPGFVEANADHVLAARESLPVDVRREAELVFTAHSIPASMAERYPYQRQLEESCAAVADAIATRLSSSEPPRWTLVYQSRSGRPQDPWLGPDVCEHLRQTAASGTRSVVLCPIGFICDHIEVLYDLDVEAAAVARELGLQMARASAVNAHPRFILALADAVTECVNRYRSGRPLMISLPASERQA